MLFRSNPDVIEWRESHVEIDKTLLRGRLHVYGKSGIGGEFVNPVLRKIPDDVDLTGLKLHDPRIVVRDDDKAEFAGDRFALDVVIGVFLEDITLVQLPLGKIIRAGSHGTVTECLCPNLLKMLLGLDGKGRVCQIGEKGGIGFGQGYD